MFKFIQLNILLLALSCISLFGQDSYTADYWQQEVHYKINATLNDTLHTLEADLELAYTNHSPDDLSFIYMHLWPNAYSAYNTAFAKQQLENGSAKYYYAPKEDKGYISDLAFEGNGKSLVLEIDDTHPDIAKLILNEPLKSGEKISLTTPFKVKIPKSFSRLGHVDQSYQITQWYPKPAVYDKDGWHQMPYLDQGEFYSEYGSFDVTITLPKNYVVGATGVLQNQAELDWLSAKAEETAKIETFPSDNSFPASDKEMKTIQYKQDNIHDFAWFADKRFHVLKGEITMPSDRRVTSWAMFTNEEADLWKKSIEYINHGTLAYSVWIGEYPYEHVTAVQSALSAGAGMEYPMITVIGKSRTPILLETVIVHEVGHNWFYGILGSNERDFPWMDEGVNSLYEARYLTEKYPDKNTVAESIGGNEQLAKLIGLDGFSRQDFNRTQALLTERKNQHQALQAPSADYLNINYGTIVYGKASHSLYYLEQYLGRKEFDRIMQQYFKSFKYKHPQPEDIRNVFEKESGKYLDWFFDELLDTKNHVDFHICKVHKKSKDIAGNPYDEIEVKTKVKNIKGPYSVSAIKDGKIVETLWYPPFGGKEKIPFPSGDYDAYEIDAIHAMPEYNRQNNSIRYNGLFPKMKPLRFRLLGELEREDRNQIFFSPIGGWNYHDSFMLGLGFYNSVFPSKKLEYTLAPMYAFDSKSLVGTGNIAYNIYPNKAFDKVKIKVAASSFSEFYNEHGIKAIDSLSQDKVVLDRKAISYYRINPSVTFELAKPYARSKVSRSITLSHTQIFKEKGLAVCDEALTDPTQYCSNGAHNNPSLYANYYMNELRYEHRNKKLLNPFSYSLSLQQGDDFLLTSLEANLRINYDRQKSMNIRLYGGYYPYNNSVQGKRIHQIGLSKTARTDYAYEELYLHRTTVPHNAETFGEQFALNQVIQEQGGFRMNLPIASTHGLFALNLSTPIPSFGIKSGKVSVPNFIKLFADVAYVYEPDISIDLFNTFQWDAGVSLEFIPNRLALHFPIVYSDALENTVKLNRGEWYERIFFTLDLRSFSILEQLRNLSF